VKKNETLPKRLVALLLFSLLSLSMLGMFSLDATQTLHAMVYTCESKFASTLDTLRILAQTDQARRMNVDAFTPLLDRLQLTDAGTLYWMAYPDGTYFTSPQGKSPYNLSERSYFPDLTRGYEVVGSLVVGYVSGRKSAVVAVPVWRNGQVVGALGASLFLEELSREVSGVFGFGENTLFFALAPDGQTTLNWKAERIFRDPREQNDPSMAQAMDVLLSLPRGQVEYTFGGKTRTVFFQKGEYTGWSYGLGQWESGE